MITIEVKARDGKILESRTFKSSHLAADWFEKAQEIYGRGITIYFRDRNAVVG